MQYGKLSGYPIRSERKPGYGRIRPVIGQLTLQAKAIQTRGVVLCIPSFL